MIQDSIQCSKTLLPAEDIVQSLINLRDELYVKAKTDPNMAEAFWKINSCLYRGYELDKKV